MKLTHVKDNIATINNTSGEISSFKMKRSAKAFSILSSGIYANKIRAIIRELSCNAYDSHIEAGKKDVPFEVHLPTHFEPYFYVRDYGTGLTHQQVFDVYTTYFESTKTDSNDYIGALGLGSKSPFSYTENFTVTAIRDGRKGVYSAFVNDDGFPSVVLMADENTDEPNGVEVKFAVDNNGDFIKFAAESETVFQHFSLKPKFTDGKIIKIPEKQYAYKNISENIHVIKYTRGGSPSCAIMGNICYPIDVNSLQNHISDKNLLNYLHYGRLEIHFDIGEVEFQTSREGLSYTSKTIQSIEQKLIELDKNLEKTVTQTIDSYDNIWQKFYKITEFYNESRIFNSALKKYTDQLLKKTDKNKEFFVDSGYGSYIHCQVIDNDIWKKFNIKVRAFITDNHRRAYASSLREINVNTRRGVDIPFSARTIFVTNEKKNGAITRSKYNFDRGNADALFVLEKGDYDDKKEPDFEGFFEYISNPPKEQIFHVNNLEKIPSKNKNSPLSSSSILSIKYNHRFMGKPSESEYIWEECGFIDLEDNSNEYFYVPLNGYDPICDDENKKIEDIKGFYSFIQKEKLSETLGINGKIYGVRKKDYEFIKNKDNWIDIQEHMASLSSSIIKDIYYGYVLGSKVNDINNIIKYKNEIIENIDKGSFFAKATNTIERHGRKFANSQNRKDFEKHLFVNYHLGDKKKTNLKTKAERIGLTLYEKYPMIFHMSHIHYVDSNKETKIKDIAEYINVMDKIKGEN